MEVVWRFEQRTFYIGSLRVKLILATHALRDNSALGEDLQITENSVTIKLTALFC